MSIYDFDDFDIMEMDDAEAIASASTDYAMDFDSAFDSCTQRVINHNGKGSYLLKH